MKEQEAGTVFALDIGTRSIIGMLGRVEQGRFYVTAIEKEEHGRRAMLDGQIVEIEQVAAVAGEVIRRLEEKSVRGGGGSCPQVPERQLHLEIR